VGLNVPPDVDVWGGSLSGAGFSSVVSSSIFTAGLLRITSALTFSDEIFKVSLENLSSANEEVEERSSVGFG
jgi:hypothetical protein